MSGRERGDVSLVGCYAEEPAAERNGFAVVPHGEPPAEQVAHRHRPHQPDLELGEEPLCPAARTRVRESRPHPSTATASSATAAAAATTTTAATAAAVEPSVGSGTGERQTAARCSQPFGPAAVSTAAAEVEASRGLREDAVQPGQGREELGADGQLGRRQVRQRRRGLGD